MRHEAMSNTRAAMLLASCLVLAAPLASGVARAQGTPAAPASAAPGSAAPGSAAPAGGAAANCNLGPQEIVEDSAKRMLSELDANRATYAKDPAKLDALVANVLLPHFDSDYAARLVLGAAWRTATPDQRKRFVDAFYHSLLRSYGTALLNFTADKFNILPYHGDPNDPQATVRTEVKKSSGERVPVEFRLHKSDCGWKAWDVVIEGISYVKSFRTDFGAEIQQKGLDEVIDRLEKEGLPHPPSAGGSQ